MNKKLVSFGFIVMMIVMLFRSVLHLKRILTERLESYYSHIDGCAKNFDWKKDDQRILFLYRNLGNKCEK